MTTTTPDPAAADAAPVAVGLIGAFHGETLARRLPGVRLAGVADPPPAPSTPSSR
jgi:myo-inositol 2-dehydrogenase / D-chiro-inositol 1-dehydrogenase